jgi:hypothetical protein
VSRPALGPTQPPVQWVSGVLSPGVKRGWGVMLTTHPHPVRRLSMSRSYTSSPHVTPWHVVGQLYFFTLQIYLHNFVLSTKLNQYDALLYMHARTHTTLLSSHITHFSLIQQSIGTWVYKPIMFLTLSATLADLFFFHNSCVRCLQEYYLKISSPYCFSDYKKILDTHSVPANNPTFS